MAGIISTNSNNSTSNNWKFNYLISFKFNFPESAIWFKWLIIKLIEWWLRVGWLKIFFLNTYYPCRYYTICLFPEITISPYPQPWFSSWPHLSWALLLCSFSDQTGDHTCPQVPSSQDSSVNHCKIIDISWFFCQFSRLGNPKDKSWSFLKRRPGRARQPKNMGRPQLDICTLKIILTRSEKG